MVNVKDVERVGTSVWVNLPSGGNGVKISASVRYHATWRGDPVRVDMNVERSQDPRNGDWSQWWAIARDAREGRYDTDATEATRGKELSDLARQRVRDACTSDALAWVETKAAQSRIRDGYYHSVVREVKDSTPWDISIRHVERLLALYGDAMGSDNVKRVRELIDAFRSWVAAVEAANA